MNYKSNCEHDSLASALPTSEPATRISTRGNPHKVTVKSTCWEAKATGNGIPANHLQIICKSRNSCSCSENREPKPRKRVLQPHLREPFGMREPKVARTLKVNGSIASPLWLVLACPHFHRLQRLFISSWLPWGGYGVQYTRSLSQWW